MSLQAERITEVCDALGLSGLASQYAALAQAAAKVESSYTDYLEQCLRAEQQERQQRSRTVLVKMAGFPSLKLLDEYDFTFAVGAPRKQIQTLRALAFVERKENVVLVGWVKPTWPLRWGIWPHRRD